MQPTMSQNTNSMQLQSIWKSLIKHSKRLSKRDAPTPQYLPETITEFADVIHRPVWVTAGLVWGYLVARMVQTDLTLRIYVTASIAASVMGGFRHKGTMGVDPRLVESYEELFQRDAEASLYRICVDSEYWVRQDLQELTFIVTAAPALLIVPGLDYAQFMNSIAAVADRLNTDARLLGTTLLPVLFKCAIPLDIGLQDIEFIINSILEK